MAIFSAFAPELMGRANRQKGGMLGLPMDQGSGFMTPPNMPDSYGNPPAPGGYQRFKDPGLLGNLIGAAGAAIGSDTYEKGLAQRQNQFLGSVQDPQNAMAEAARLGRTDWVDRLKGQQARDQSAAQDKQAMAGRQRAVQMLKAGDYEGAAKALLEAGDIQGANSIWSGQENRAQATSTRMKALGQNAASLAQGLKSVPPEGRAQILQQFEDDLRALGATDKLLQDMASGDDQVLDAIIARGMSANEYADNARQDIRQNSGFTLGNGQTRFGADGRPIASVAKTYAPRAAAKPKGGAPWEQYR